MNIDSSRESPSAQTPVQQEPSGIQQAGTMSPESGCGQGDRQSRQLSAAFLSLIIHRDSIASERRN